MITATGKIGYQIRREAAMVITSRRRRFIMAVAAFGMVASAAPAPAEGATFWTIRPDVREPLLWVGLSPPGTVDQFGNPVVLPVLAVPTAGALDQHWSFQRVRYGYRIVNRQSGGCFYGTAGQKGSPGEVHLVCTEANQRRTHSWNFHRPGKPQPIRTLSSGVYQIRFTDRVAGEEKYGRCLAVPYGIFQLGARLGTASCNSGKGPSQRFLVKSFVEP